MTLQKIGLENSLILGHVQLKRKIGILNEYNTKYTGLRTIKLKTYYEFGCRHLPIAPLIEYGLRKIKNIPIM